jgi:hypothetical protein
MVNENLGVYHEPHDSARFACLFGHVGNYPRDVEGCVAFGLTSASTPSAVVYNSRSAVAEFQAWMTKNWSPDMGLLITSAAS